VTVSQANLTNQPRSDAPAPKQELDVYTVMLIISFVCIVTATILLYIELDRWGPFPWWSPPSG
jgi:hypothetical protein